MFMALFDAEWITLAKINITSLKEKHSDEVTFDILSAMYFCTVKHLFCYQCTDIKLEWEKIISNVTHFKEQRSVEYSDIKLDGKSLCL